MTVHPDDVAAVNAVMVKHRNWDEPSAEVIIITLDAARAKRVSKDVGAVVHRLRTLGGPHDASSDILHRAANLLEAQALRIADLTQSLADAKARVEQAEKEIKRLRQIYNEDGLIDPELAAKVKPTNVFGPSSVAQKRQRNRPPNHHWRRPGKENNNAK